MRVSGVHYTDIYPKSFQAFRKKYLKKLKDPDRHYYYVQFTNFMQDVLSKKPYEDPDHHDPVAVYAYPLSYVLTHPADIWYGNKAKYLRLLKQKPKANILMLQSLTESEASSLLYKMGLDAADMDVARALWPDRIGKGTGSFGRAFFQVVQMDLSDVKVPRRLEERRELAKNIPIRSGIEQTKLLRKAGLDGIEDTARTNKQAVINDREPEQIAFLHRHAYDVVEVVPLNLKHQSSGVGTAQNMDDLAPKLAARIADLIGDRITDKDGKTFWTKAGREIVISFDRPRSYYEGKKLGEKKHKEDKLSSSYATSVSLTSERGTEKYSSSEDTFEEIAQTVAQWFRSRAVVPDFTPISRASRKAEKDAASAAYYKAEREKKALALQRSAPELLDQMADVAQRLGVPFTHKDYWNSSDAQRDDLDGIVMVVGRHLSNEMYRTQNRLREANSNSWDWYSHFDRSKFDEAAESVRRIADRSDTAAIEEVIDLYRAAMNWMLDNKLWSYQHPAAFFTWLAKDMDKNSEAAVTAAMRDVRFLLKAAADLLR